MFFRAAAVRFRAGVVPSVSLWGCSAIPQGDAAQSALRPKGVSVLDKAFNGELLCHCEERSLRRSNPPLDEETLAPGASAGVASLSFAMTRWSTGCLPGECQHGYNPLQKRNCPLRGRFAGDASQSHKGPLCSPRRDVAQSALMPSMLDIFLLEIYGNEK
jgi:hypothetical protein